MSTVSLRRATAVIVGVMLALCMTSVAFVQKGFAASSDLTASEASVLQTQETEAENIAIIKKFIKRVNALPAASKVKLTDGKKVAKAADLYLSAINADEALWVDDDNASFDDYTIWGSQYKSLNKKYSVAVKKYDQVKAKYDRIVKKAQAKVGKLKVTGVKVVVGKKRATVSWKRLGKQYRYMVIYRSTKKNATVWQEDGIAKTRVTIKKLKSGQKYKFTVLAYRPETYNGIGILPDVHTKNSKTVTSKKVK